MERDPYLRDRPTFRVLTDDQIRELHLTTLEVLERTGVEIYEDEALKLLRDAGCSVDGKRVRIPAHLTQKMLRAAPERIAVRDRSGANGMFLEGHKTYFGTGSDCPNVIDLHTGERSPSALQDVADLAKLTDACSNLDFVMSMALARNLPAHTADLHQFVAMIEHTTKPIVFTAFSLESLKAIYDICILIADGEERFRQLPFVVHYSEPTSPLRHTKEAMEKLLYCAEKSIPIVYTPGIMAGSSSPVTLAGTIVQTNAESLSGLVVSQLKREGAPFVYGAFITIMDMRTTLFSYGAPELHLMSAAMADMAHFYRLPSWSQAVITDAKRLDAQAGIEATSSALMAGLSGANLIHDVGYLESGLTSSFESILMGDEIVGMVRRILRGIDVNRETTAADLIDRVGPGGCFLLDTHTLDHFRSQFWFPQYLDRNRYDKWHDLGEKTLFGRLNEAARELLRTHTAEPLAPEKRAEIAKILDKQDRRKA